MPVSRLSLRSIRIVMARSSKPLERVSPDHQGQQLRTYLDRNGIPHNFLSKGLAKQPSTINGYFNSATINSKTRQAILTVLEASYEQVFRNLELVERPLTLAEEIEESALAFNRGQVQKLTLVEQVLQLQSQLGQVSRLAYERQLEEREVKPDQLRQEAVNLTALAMNLVRELGQTKA
jgi:hypothetical protein